MMKFDSFIERSGGKVRAEHAVRECCVRGSVTVETGKGIEEGSSDFWGEGAGRESGAGISGGKEMR